MVVEKSKKTFDLPYSDSDLKKIIVFEKPTLGGKQFIKNLLKILLINIMRDETEKENSNSVFLRKSDVGDSVSEGIIRFLKKRIIQNFNRRRKQCVKLQQILSFPKIQSGYRRINHVVFFKAGNRTAKEFLRDGRLFRRLPKNFLSIPPNYFSKTFKKFTYITSLI